MKIVFVALLFGIIVTSFADVPAQQEGVIRVRRVVLEDTNGIVQIDITAEQNEPDILLYDSDGDGVVVLNRDRDTTGCEVYNKEGKVRLKISARYIVMCGDDGRERFRLTKEGVSLYDEQGKLIFFLSSNLGLFDEDGKLRMRLRAK